MFFLPYRLDHTKNGVPFFTMLVMAICIFLFIDQVESDKDYQNKLISFCSNLSTMDRDFLRDLRKHDSLNYCQEIFEDIRASANPELEVTRLAGNAPKLKIFASKEASYSYSLIKLEELHRTFERQVPSPLTRELAYDPNDTDWLKMLTSTIAHGDTMHLFGNLLFFYIFSSAVELLIGSLMYVVFFFTATIATSLAYTFVMIGSANSMPTIGLSGVVMATLAALTVLAPLARIRCFLWIVVFFKRFTLPVLLIAAWYIGWDLFEMNRLGMTSGINYIAHISGALIGALFAIPFAIAATRSKNGQSSTRLDV